VEDRRENDADVDAGEWLEGGWRGEITQMRERELQREDGVARREKNELKYFRTGLYSMYRQFCVEITFLY
jgi:hypothetical protein